MRIPMIITWGLRERLRALERADGDRRWGTQLCIAENGWCPFLDQNKLCDIYSELGEEALCEVCTEYPRFVVEYGDVREKSLSVSCEEVGRIIFSDEGKMSYEDIELPDLGIEDEFYEDEEEEPFEEDMEEFCSHLEEY